MAMTVIVSSFPTSKQVHLRKTTVISKLCIGTMEFYVVCASIVRSENIWTPLSDYRLNERKSEGFQHETNIWKLRVYGSYNKLVANFSAPFSADSRELYVFSEEHYCTTFHWFTVELGYIKHGT